MKDKKVSNLVFSSSCSIYGNPDKLPVTETSVFKPATSPYGATKQMCESIIRDTTNANQDMKSILLRYFNPIGAHPSASIGELPIGVPTNLVPFVTQTAAGIRKELIVYGNDYPTLDGTCVRDYIHVVDLAKAHVKAVEVLTKKKPGYCDAINLGTGSGNSVLEVIKTFEKVADQKVPYKIGPRRAGDVISAYASVKKSKDILGWKTELSLPDALRDAWRWQQSIQNS